MQTKISQAMHPWSVHHSSTDFRPGLGATFHIFINSKPTGNKFIFFYLFDAYTFG